MPGHPPRHLLLAGILVGAGLVGTLDEVVLHQLLDWHHFLERAPDGPPVPAAARRVGLVSDGLFHVVATVALGAGLLLLGLSGPLRDGGRRLAGALLVGGGAFNLYDGVVQHLVLGLHPVRRGVDPLPYDIAWIAVALLLLAAGLALLRGAARRPSAAGGPGRRGTG